MKEIINILFSTNSDYVTPLTVCITSIFENNKNHEVNIYVFYNNISNDQKKNLNILEEKYNQKINLIPVPEYYFNDVPTLRWSKEAYYRLLINELLPKNIKRLIYLDCDTIVNKNLIELNNLDLKGNCIAALPEIQNTFYRQKIGLDADGYYFQSGVMLFDIEKCIDILNYENSIKIIEKIGDRLIAVDQDVVNMMFDGKIEPLDQKFNNCKITNFYGNNWYRLLNYINKKDIDKTYIFHYAVGKPWNNMFSGACEKIWYKYLNLSPYYYVYHKRYNRFKYKILRIGIMKIIFYEYIKITPIIEKISKNIFSQDIYNILKNFYKKNIK